MSDEEIGIAAEFGFSFILRTFGLALPPCYK